MANHTDCRSLPSSADFLQIEPAENSATAAGLTLVDSAERGNSIARGVSTVEGLLLKRHRNRNCTALRKVVLDYSASTLTYFTGFRRKPHIPNFVPLQRLGVFRRLADHQEPKPQRVLPVELLTAYVISGEDVSAPQHPAVLIVCYRELQAPGNPALTRSIFFMSNRDSEEGCIQEISEWYGAIKACKAGHEKPLAKQTVSAFTSACTNISRMQSNLTLANKNDGLYLCGNVMKRSQMSASKWHTRFLVIDGHHLRYYGNPMDALPLEEIQLEKGLWAARNGTPDMFPEVNYPHSFTVSTLSREFYFRASDADECQNWVAILDKLQVRFCRTDGLHLGKKQSTQSSLPFLLDPSFSNATLMTPLPGKRLSSTDV